MVRPHYGSDKFLIALIAPILFTLMAFWMPSDGRTVRMTYDHIVRTITSLETLLKSVNINEFDATTRRTGKRNC